MQEWESLKIILSNLNREIDRVIKDIESLEGWREKASLEAIEDKISLEVFKGKVEERATRIEDEAKYFKQEVNKKFAEMLGEVAKNKKGMLAAIFAVLSGTYFLGKELDIVKILGNLLGVNK